MVSQETIHTNGTNGAPHGSKYPPFKDTGSLDRFTTVQVTPCIGTEFKNVDLAEWLRVPNSDDMIKDLALLLAQRGVIFFRGQNNINNELQKELCKRLNAIGGAPQGNGFYRHSLLAMQGEDPEMGKVDQDRLEKMYRPKADNMPRQSHTLDWHTDSSFEANSPDYTILKMAELPATGGDTLWASGYELYDRLTEPYKRFFESLTATYKSVALSGYAAKNPEAMDSGPRGAPNNVGLDFENHHPVVRTHPLTGWKSIFSCGTNRPSIDGVTDAESAKLMRKLMRLLVDNHDLQLRFQWHDVNDLAIWDNRCTFHAATQDHFGKGTRIGWRCMTMGEIPFYDPESKSRMEATGGWPYKIEA